MQISFIALALAYSALSVSAAPHPLVGRAAAAQAGGAAGGDPRTSLTLDPKVIASGFASDGQGNATSPPEPGQVASLTSTNNFINFCLTINKPITDGTQIKGGSCNPAPMGVIASADKMPASKFVFPKNMGTVKANTQFNIQMAINNIVTGHFVNPNMNYYCSQVYRTNGHGSVTF